MSSKTCLADVLLTAGARAAVAAYHANRADRVIAEKNQGGDMVENTIRLVDRNVPVKLVHATRGKAIRAEPIAALYEQKRVHHVGVFSEVEAQMCEFTADFNRSSAGYSPDRVDALVWALSHKPPLDGTAGIKI